MNSDERNPDVLHPLQPNAEVPRQRGGYRGQDEQRNQAEDPVDEDHRRRERLGAGKRRRIGDAHNVAPDIARQEIVEKRGDEKRLGQRAQADVDRLQPEQQPPAPRADREHEPVDAKRGDSPRRIHLPEACRHVSMSARRKRITSRTVLTASLRTISTSFSFGRVIRWGMDPRGKAPRMLP